MKTLELSVSRIEYEDETKKIRLFFDRNQQIECDTIEEAIQSLQKKIAQENPDNVRIGLSVHDSVYFTKNSSGALRMTNLISTLTDKEQIQFVRVLKESL